MRVSDLWPKSRSWKNAAAGWLPRGYFSTGQKASASLIFSYDVRGRRKASACCCTNVGKLTQWVCYMFMKTLGLCNKFEIFKVASGRWNNLCFASMVFILSMKLAFFTLYAWNLWIDRPRKKKEVTRNYWDLKTVFECEDFPALIRNSRNMSWSFRQKLEFRRSLWSILETDAVECRWKKPVAKVLGTAQPLRRRCFFVVVSSSIGRVSFLLRYFLRNGKSFNEKGNDELTSQSRAWDYVHTYIHTYCRL